MNIQLRKMNVVKQVDSEDKAKTLEANGFKRILEAEKETAASEGKVLPEKPDKKEMTNTTPGEKKPPSGKKPSKKSVPAKTVEEASPEEGEKNDTGAPGENSGGSDGQPENG